VARASDRLEGEAHTEIPYACGCDGGKEKEAYCTIYWAVCFRAVVKGMELKKFASAMQVLF